MPKQINRLTAVSISNLKHGRHSDGAGLYCEVKGDGRRYWIYRDSRGPKLRWKGLGSAATISLKTVREKVHGINQAIYRGEDPFAVASKKVTFQDAAKEFVALHSRGLKNEQSRRGWSRMLGPKYCPGLQSLGVSEITTADVLKDVEKLWWSKNATGRRVLSRVAMLMDYCAEKGWREGGNPALKSLFKRSLPHTGRVTKHHVAMDYNLVPAFVTDLRERVGMAPVALRFIIATALRCQEALGMRWDEVDLDGRVAVIGAGRMKMKKPFTVVLNDMAMEILTELHETKVGDYVFVGNKDGQLSPMTVYPISRAANVTTHGFRASFRTFAGNETSAAFETAEQCLSHEYGNAVSRSYIRGTSLQKRADLMRQWGDWCAGKGKVVRLRAAG